MSMMYCDRCDRTIDTDLDAEHFIDHLDDTLDRIDATIDKLHATMQRPGSQPLTSRQMEAREDRRRSMATGVKINGGKVRDSYK